MKRRLGMFSSGACLLVFMWGGLLLAPGVAPAAVAPAKIYVMETYKGWMWVISIDDTLQMATTPVTVSDPIVMSNQLNQAGDGFNDLNVLGNGELVVESHLGGGANNLSYWSADGVYDSTRGAFGFGGNSLGIAVLHDGTFLSHRRYANDYYVFRDGATNYSYKSSIYSQWGVPITIVDYGQICGRRNGGFVIAVGASADQSHVFDDRRTG